MDVRVLGPDRARRDWHRDRCDQSCDPALTYLTLSTFSVTTPIVLLIAGRVTRTQEHDALRAGAWAVLGTPFDREALLLRLAVFIEPKRELERVSEECLVDRVSGLYTPSGLT